MRLRLTAILLCCVAAIATPSAYAQTSIAPPGKSGADQYFESVPSARGNVAPPSASGAGSASGTAAERRLARLGKDGQAAAALAVGGAGSGKSTSAGSSGGSRATGADASLTSLRRLVTGSDAGGLGVWLPILLGASLLVAIAFALTRRRHPEAS